MPRRGTTHPGKDRLTGWVRARISRRRLTQAVGCMIVVWILYTLLHYLLTDYCGGSLYVRALCEQYRRGNVAGSLCYDLCYEHLPLLHRCYGDTKQFRLFQFNDTHTGKVLLSHLEGMDGRPISLNNTYRFPEEGAQMSEFNSALERLVAERLGEGEHGGRVRGVWRYADFNRDGQVSSAEAKSIWSLLQINDFFMHFIFADTFHVPKILGTCGDTYFLEVVPHSRLYSSHNEESVLEWIFPSLHKVWWPSWADRVKLSMGLLELSVEAYQHGMDGEFYLCNVTMDTIGYMHSYEPKLLDLSKVVSRHELGISMQENTCNADGDCEFTPQCITKCNLSERKCTGDIVRPSLFYMCQVINPFILSDVPKMIRGDLLNLFSRCNKLQGYMRDLPLQHSLVYTDLKSLLWRRVSSTIT